MPEACDGERLLHVPEAARTVRHFMHLITNLQLDPDMETALFDDVFFFVSFLEKYDCALALDQLLV